MSVAASSTVVLTVMVLDVCWITERDTWTRERILGQCQQQRGGLVGAAWLVAVPEFVLQQLIQTMLQRLGQSYL